MATVGFAPEQIKPVMQDPEGFDKFWDDSKAILARIPIGAQRTPYADKTTATLNAYEVNFAVPNGDMAPMGSSRIYGILTEPKAEGKYPALLRVPGAGVYGVSGIVKEAYENTITLSIGINGVPLTLPGPVYNSLMSGALSAYQRYGIDTRDKYYYRRVYLGCIRAIDYLASLPNWDGKTVAVIGESQGGGLSIVTAALDPRVKALAAFYPAMSDITAYTEGRAGGWPDIFKTPENRTRENLATASFYDVVNFARRVKVPGIFTWGYNDETCAPSSTYAAYNTITAPKTLFLSLESGHSATPQQRDRVAAWMQEFLKTGKAPAE
jgi:cephalosporin-C deacetylase-like acetyl esterase